jgi:SAM-dependent methyltransferase
MHMTLRDIVQRQPVPVPWAEGDNIPWNDPEFSARMLREHLSQDHDMASRRLETVEKHVAWIHRELLHDQPGRVLDLACGPGLYASRLARLGHSCVGIDFSPASIDHAAAEAHKESLDCTYTCEDLRQADYGTGFDLAMLIFGQVNVFRPAEAEAILHKAHAALRKNGTLLLEPSTLESHQREGRSWYSAPSGLFSDQPHLCLDESHWDAETKTLTTRFYVIDAATGAVTRHALTDQAYTDDEFLDMLHRSGFSSVTMFSSLGGDEKGPRGDCFAITAGRQ